LLFLQSINQPPKHWSTRLIVQQHRHDKHEDFLSLRLHGRHNNARTTWVGKLYCHLVACDVVEYLVDSTALEADAAERLIGLTSALAAD
jgi:hypothetical protein